MVLTKRKHHSDLLFQGLEEFVKGFVSIFRLVEQREYRQVYLVYPTLGYEIEAFIPKNNLDKSLIWRSASAKLDKWQTPPAKLFNHLNFSSLLYLKSIEDPLKRAFYEQEAIRGCWTVKELDRQVSSLYFERMGLSKGKLAMQKLSVKDSCWRK